MSPGARPGLAAPQERRAVSQERRCSRAFGAVEGFFRCHNTKTQQNPTQRVRGRAAVAPQGTRVGHGSPCLLLPAGVGSGASASECNGVG